MMLTLGKCELSSLYEKLSGRSIRPEVNKTPGGAFSWVAAGEGLLALTRQPIRRPGQPKAAAPDSGSRVALAPGERSYIQGKPMSETGQLYFRDIPRCRCRCRRPGDDARAWAGAGELWMWLAWPTGLGKRGRLAGEGWADGEGADREGTRTGKGRPGIRD